MNFQKIVIVKTILILAVECAHEVIEKACAGTSDGFHMAEPPNLDLHYRIQIDRYSKCTYVEGNLEITWISNATKYNLDYLQHIREVTGYVLIMHVQINDFILPDLQIIRGKTLVDWNTEKRNRYALFVGDSRLNTLQLPGLRTILNGSVFARIRFCYLKTINWNKILYFGAPKYNDFGKVDEITCGKCDPTCEAGCWAGGANNCQKLNGCSHKCTNGCSIYDNNDCCHVFCDGGCTSPHEDDCLTYKYYRNDDIYEWLPSICINHYQKKFYSRHCVDQCPDRYKNDNGFCVRTCPPSKVSKYGECRVCGEEEFCPKICNSHGTTISNNTFNGSKKIHPDDLRAFTDLQEVTDNLRIQGHHAQFTNLSFFGNLSMIGGSLYILKSSLKSLELKSLKQLYGVVAISGNPDLCYVGSMDWSKLQMTESVMSQVLGNRSPDECKKNGYVCYEQCVEATGCMGGGADQCLQCVNWTYNDTCVTDCSALADNRKFFQNHKTKMCGDCHPECANSCTNSDASSCDACIHVKDGPNCARACPKDKYADNGICQPCHDLCDGCLGPKDTISPDGCIRLHEEYLSYNSDSDISFKVIAYIVIGFVISGFVIMPLVILFCSCKARKAHNEKVKMSLLAGFEDTVPLCETGDGPNMRTIRIIKEAEIHKGSVLGNGAFGQVLKGLWVPENENCKIPIAIKILKDMNDSQSSAEFMNEAQIMASLDHPNILKLMAVCMTDDLMMITQLMPLGSLLAYVRSHKAKIGSKAMLNWSAQIARGMAYLEQRRLVHRDLAARNVLVQSPSSVRITDFGMTKLLKQDSLVYESTGGKAAVKWLAPECLEEKIFTSKSDVWAFGVTIWEVLAYGATPYTDVKSQDVPQLVFAGEKLLQPEICSLELYAILLLCWNLKPDLRPSFQDLKKKYTEMASDPGRYLMIVGDKLMRLPEFTKEDERDAYKDVAELDDIAVPIIEAERYIEPNFPAVTEYLLPNPPCQQSDGQVYLEMEAPTIQVLELADYLEPNLPKDLPFL